MSLSSCDACSTGLFRVSEQDGVSSARLSRDVYAAIWQLKTLYPGFAEWYSRLFSCDGSLDPDREILVFMYKGVVAGVAILKRSEQKICTLYVVDGFRGESVGSELVESSLETLGMLMVICGGGPMIMK